MRNATRKDLLNLTAENCPHNVMFYTEEFGLVHRKPLFNDWTLEHPNLWVLAETADGSRCIVMNPSTQFLAVPAKPQPEQKKRKKYIRPTGTGYLEKIPFDFSKLEVGDKVQLRNGAVETVHIINNYDDSFRTYNNGGRYAGYWYYKNGKIQGFDWQENVEDILYILKKTKKPTPKKDKWEDEFVLLERSTGKEVVFTRKELQIVKETIGKVGAKSPVEFSQAYDKFVEAGFSEYREFTNNVDLVTTKDTPLFKENI